MLPFLSKLESLAGSAVRAAGKVDADLIVVYTATGVTHKTEAVQVLLVACTRACAVQMMCC